LRSIHFHGDVCQKRHLQCMGPLDETDPEGKVQKQQFVQYQVVTVGGNTSGFELESYNYIGCHGVLAASYNTGSNLEAKKLFTFQCAQAWQYPSYDAVYLRWDNLPADCSLYHGKIMLTTTTTTTTTTTLYRGACDLEDAFRRNFFVVAGSLGKYGKELDNTPAIGALLNHPTDLVVDLAPQIVPVPKVKKHDTKLPAFGAVVIPPGAREVPYGAIHANHGIVVMPPGPEEAFTPQLKDTPDGAVVLPGGSEPPPQPFVMVPGDVEKQGPETLPYAALSLPPRPPGPSGASYGAAVLPPGAHITPAGAQIISYGAEVKPDGLPRMPSWAEVMPSSAMYGPPGHEGTSVPGVASVFLPGSKPLPLAQVVPPGEEIVLPQPSDPRVVPVGAQQLFIADSANHAVRLVNLTTGIISTVAGTLGRPGSSGDGGLATSAFLMYPRGVALDATARTLYIADNGNHAVRRVNLINGKIQTIAGIMQSPGSVDTQGVATLVRLNFPMGLALNAAGTQLFIADSGSHVIRMLDIISGKISTVAGQVGMRGTLGDNSPAILAQLSTPMHLALHEDASQLYFSDHDNHAVRVVDLIAGSVSTVAGILGFKRKAGDAVIDGPARECPLNLPTGLALDPNAQVLYIADSSNFAVRQLDLTSGANGPPRLSTLSSRPGFLDIQGNGGPLGLAFDPLTKSMYVAEAYNDVVQKIDTLGEIPHQDVKCKDSHAAPL
jgi:DNA-binding beta-propeller fold protein YncE